MFFFKPDFDRAEKIARELRLMQPYNNLALNVRLMEFDRNIHFETFENYSAITQTPLEILTKGGRLFDGYTIKKNGNIYLILYYGSNSNSSRLNWTLAHEIGHIYLGHECDGDIQEIEANWFAAELLMPIPIIYEICRNVCKVSAETLVYIFDVSYQAAYKKIDSMNRMCGFLTYLQEDFQEKYGQIIQLLFAPKEHKGIITT